MTRPRPIARLKVTLADVEPKVVRRVDVPLKIRLDRLHLVMQAAMGWTNSHLFAFTVGGTSWGVADPDFPNDCGDDDTLPASEVTLSDLVEDTGTRTFHYLYDFGDDWDHVVRLERVFDADPLERYPQLVMAEGRCPPEDDDPSEDGSSVHEMARVSKTREGWTTRLRRVPSGHRRSRPRGARASPRLVWWCSFDPADPGLERLLADLDRLAKRWAPRPRQPKTPPRT